MSNKICKEDGNHFLKRKVGIRWQRKILIICEGKKTEPNYFRKFPNYKREVIIEVKGKGYNTISLVDEAIKKRQEAMEKGEPYNEIWCVFDKNSFSNSNFNSAIQKAEANRIETAYSNEAFELWYLLHFIYFDSAITRDDYIIKLKKYLGGYKKDDINMYGKLINKQDNAIKNTIKLFSKYSRINPAKNNPSTTVHLLVERLNEYLGIR